MSLSVWLIAGSSPGTSLARITVIVDDRRKGIDQADLLVDTGQQQQYAAIETGQPSVESGRNLLLAGMMARAYRRRWWWWWWSLRILSGCRERHQHPISP
jgi:hypothetical protein